MHVESGLTLFLKMIVQEILLCFGGATLPRQTNLLNSFIYISVQNKVAINL